MSKKLFSFVATNSFLIWDAKQNLIPDGKGERTNNEWKKRKILRVKKSGQEKLFLAEIIHIIYHPVRETKTLRYILNKQFQLGLNRQTKDNDGSCTAMVFPLLIFLSKKCECELFTIVSSV